MDLHHLQCHKIDKHLQVNEDLATALLTKVFCADGSQTD